MADLIYNVNEKPKKIKEWILYTLQMILSVFVATVLIANICGTPISSCLLGACVGTLIYEFITRFKSPMFISSCGATVSAVIGALMLGLAAKVEATPAILKLLESHGFQLENLNIVDGFVSITSPQMAAAIGWHLNYMMVFIGGLVIIAVYTIFALLYKIKGASFINKLLPPTIVGAITIVIGLNLATFLVSYTHNSTSWEVVVAITTMLVVALTSHYFKGFLKTIPFLFGIAFGYVFCLILKAFGVNILDFSAFSNLQWYPELTFLKWSGADFSWANVGKTVLLFLPVALCAVCEHISDHKVLGNIIGQDLIHDPGLDKTLIGDGVASAVGSAVCGLPNTSYGESIGAIGFSRVASVWITCAAAITLGIFSFFAPVTAFIQTIPSCVHGGCSMVLYGTIAASGLKTLMNNRVDLEDNKNLTIVSVVLCVGVSGIFLFTESLAGVSLAMILGIILNLILRRKEFKEI